MRPYTLSIGQALVLVELPTPSQFTAEIVPATIASKEVLL